MASLGEEVEPLAPDLTAAASSHLTRPGGWLQWATCPNVLWEEYCFIFSCTAWSLSPLYDQAWGGCRPVLNRLQENALFLGLYKQMVWA